MLTFSVKSLNSSLIQSYLRLGQANIIRSSNNALRFCYSKLKKSDRESSQSLLKQYFSSRLTLSTSQLQGYLVQLSKNNDVKIRDHRWESLYMTIDKFHKDFSMESKIEIIQALGRMKQNNQLYLTLYRSIVSQFHKLTIQRMAILLWSMVKAQQNDKNIVLAIYKKLHKLMQNDEKIKLYKQRQEFPIDYNNQNEENNQRQIIHHMHESSFIHLIWALQKTRTLDEKLILDLLKFTFKQDNLNNLQKLRIQNLCLLAYCIEQMKFQKYRISQTIVNQIMKSWEQLQKLNVLTLVLLCGSFSKFLFYQQQYLNQYQSKFTPEQISKKQQYIQKQRRFIFLIVQTIFIKQNRSNNKNFEKNKKKFKRQYQEENQLEKLDYQLSSKFASQIILQLGKLNLYEKNIWYKLLSSITDDVDQAQVDDLSMTLTGICKLNTKEIPHQDVKQIIYRHKKILCRRVFQIYTSLTGRSLQNIKELVFQKKIQNQFVPSRIRRQVQQQFMSRKMEQKFTSENSQQRKSDVLQKNTQKSQGSVNQQKKFSQQETEQNFNPDVTKKQNKPNKKNRPVKDQNKVESQNV